MNIFVKRKWMVLLLMVWFHQSFAQEAATGFDTIHLSREGNAQGSYSVKHALITSVTIFSEEPEVLNTAKNTVGGDIGRGALTLFTGLSIGSTKDMDWLFKAEITTNNDKLNWQIATYCHGTITKENLRVKDDEGYSILDTKYSNTFDWNTGAIAFVISNTDTLGRFNVHLHPREIEELEKWTTKVYKENSEKKHKPANHSIGFALTGIFMGKESILIFNQEKNMLYSFTGIDLQCRYFMGKDNPLIRKKKRIQPFLLCESSLTDIEKLDQLRLTMMGQWFLSVLLRSSLTAE